MEVADQIPEGDYLAQVGEDCSFQTRIIPQSLRQIAIPYLHGSFRTIIAEVGNF